MEGTEFRYVIKFVADMNKAVKFYRDILGLQLKFESSGWSEFVTGETTLALHPASDKNPAGTSVFVLNRYGLSTAKSCAVTALHRDFRS